MVKVSKSATKGSSQIQGDDSDSQDEEDTSGLGDKDSKNPLYLDSSSEDNIMHALTRYQLITKLQYYFKLFFQLRKIVRAVRSSLQCKIKSSLITANNPADKRKPLM